ncbi:hypothetical protein D3C71_962170 [compost metagenome]
MIGRRRRRVDPHAGRADEEEHARHFLGVQREILRAHLQRRFVHVVLAHHRLQARQHLRGQRRVVHRGRVAFRFIDVGHRLGPVRGSRVIGHVAQVGEDLLAHAFIEGADGADHLHFIGNDVVADAAVDRAEGQHRRLLGEVGAAADDGLCGADQIGSGHNRVNAVPRCRAMRLAADHLDAETIGRGHQRATAHRDLPCLHAGEHMQAEYRLGLEVGKQAFLQHQRSTALFRRRRAFLGGLEDQHHLARQVLLHRHQRFGHAQQGGGVRVMATGVHHAHGLPAVLRGGF